MSKKPIEKVLQWAAKRFPASAVSAETIEAYAEELERVDPGRLELAFKAILTKSQFWPSLATLMQAEKELILDSSEKQLFRQLELALIQLSDERKGGVITREQYVARYAKILDASGFTKDQLAEAKVYGGTGPEPGLTWEELDRRRSSYLPQDAPERKQVPKDRPRVSHSVEGIRAALSNSLTGTAKLPADIKKWLDEENRTL